jgi:L-ascorbate metabolism protein UlaG (beta-lactamase superfamily)
MQLQLIRNATLKLAYGGATILVDPYFAPKHSLPSFTGRSQNPMVELPVAVEDILDGVELVIVSHLHTDHFDSVAKETMPKHWPLICQQGDESTIRQAGFTDVTPLAGEISWRGIRITRREGNHGTGAVLDKMGPVMGFTLEAEGEPSVYWAGDTVLYPPVLETIKAFEPDVIVTHSCGAMWDDTLIVMDAEQTVETAEVAPRATVIATHMEALDHATVSRDALRAHAASRRLSPERLLVPADGELLTLPAAAR